MVEAVFRPGGILVRRLVNALDTRNAEHGQATTVLSQFLPAEDRFWIGAAWHFVEQSVCSRRVVITAFDGFVAFSAY